MIKNPSKSISISQTQNLNLFVIKVSFDFLLSYQRHFESIRNLALGSKKICINKPQWFVDERIEIKINLNNPLVYLIVQSLSSITCGVLKHR